jgi:cyanate permease
MLLKLLAALCSIALISWNQQDHKSTLSSNEKKHGKSWEIMEENLYKWRCLFGKIIELLLRGFSACD